ncbi:interleukin-22 receptor subunit alpha-2-like [Leucoraja erinacea]|uniref:interleukin-22 receptor subunit alpha-2-like n=1 Tax=Leucoraja erinaceus TaxID=7782 RepID=UPI0024567523|nr:interleukin-22 receptor subunit alpha-2-like [Leucoraja erinacea]XP_055491899.1 interleukin-22 receptor subunit alpha-2-like [Leucoraja erinacea]
MGRFSLPLFVILGFTRLVGAQVSGHIPEPQQVNFKSTDFYNVLQWRKGSHNSMNAVYNVEYKMYGEKRWNNKTECWKIHRMFCDLTQETRRFMEPHLARVRALEANGQSNWAMSETIIPFWETVIGPPRIKLIPKARSILVKMLPPRTPFRKKNGSWITLDKIYNGIEYLIEISDNLVENRSDLYTATGITLSVWNLKPKATYCVRAQIKILLFSKVSDYSGKKCVTTF